MASSPIQTATPSSLRSRRSRSGSSISSNLSLDLSNLPGLIKPADPTNTLLITNLDDIAIFRPENLQTLRQTIDEHVPIYSWSPLKSFRRIIVAFHEIASAETIKHSLDGEIIMNCRVRVYFGAHTDISPTAKHLEAPKVDKLFFISPPPSPPHDWEIRNEDPPNKEVHAEDLAQALSKLHARDQNETPDKIMHDPEDPASHQMFNNGRVRSRSTTLVYEPTAHGSNSLLPAISVEDCEFIDSPEESYEFMTGVAQPAGPMLHTSRPPVELMQS